MTANFTPSGVTVLPPTATGVTVGGRVTTQNGQGLRNAFVHMTDSAGQRRTVVTRLFGFYNFNEVQAGSSYVTGVSSKRY